MVNFNYEKKREYITYTFANTSENITENNLIDIKERDYKLKELMEEIFYYENEIQKAQNGEELTPRRYNNMTGPYATNEEIIEHETNYLNKVRDEYNLLINLKQCRINVTEQVLPITKNNNKFGWVITKFNAELI